MNYRDSVIDCGCWECQPCGGTGLSDKEDKFQCDLCDGSGWSKRCPRHAKDEGWLDEK